MTNLRLPVQYDERLFAAAGISGVQGPYYNLNRWYLPSMGRYLELDPMALAGGLNGFFVPDWYGYGLQNPLTWIDPSGLKPKRVPADVLFGETGGLYPLGGSIYDPSSWTPASFALLQEARSTLVEFLNQNPGVKVWSARPKKKDKWGQRIYGMCKDAANTPSTTDIDDATNFWIGENGAPFGVFGPNTTSRDLVVRFGPFRNVGGGDAKGPLVYLWFYTVGTD